MAVVKISSGHSSPVCRLPTSGKDVGGSNSASETGNVEPQTVLEGAECLASFDLYNKSIYHQVVVIPLPSSSGKRSMNAYHGVLQQPPMGHKNARNFEMSKQSLDVGSCISSVFKIGLPTRLMQSDSGHAVSQQSCFRDWQIGGSSANWNASSKCRVNLLAKRQCDSWIGPECIGI